MCDSTKIEEFYTYPPLTGCLQFHYVNVSVLIKLLQKTQCFYLDYHKFSIKSYVLDVYYNRLTTYDLMAKYRFFFTFYHFDSDPRYTPFLLYMFGGNLGSLLYGDVSVMFVQT